MDSHAKDKKTDMVPKKRRVQTKGKRPLTQISREQRMKGEIDNKSEVSSAINRQEEAITCEVREPSSQSDTRGSAGFNQRKKNGSHNVLPHGPVRFVVKAQVSTNAEVKGQCDTLTFEEENSDENKQQGTGRNLLEGDKDTQQADQKVEWQTSCKEVELEVIYPDEVEERYSDSDSGEHQLDMGSDKLMFVDDNPFLVSLQNQEGRVVDLHMGDISDIFEEKSCERHVNEIYSDELSIYLDATQKDVLGEQVSKRDFSNPNQFWQLWDSFTSTGGLTRDHLRHIYEKLEKEDFLQFFACQSSQAPLYQTSGLGKLLMSFFVGTPIVTKQGRLRLDNHEKSQVKKHLFIEDAVSSAPQPISIDNATNAPSMVPTSTLSYVSRLSTQEQKTQPALGSKVLPTNLSSPRLPWWKKAAQTVQVALFWMGISTVAIGLGFWAHTVLSPLPIMKAQNVWLLMSCAAGVGIGWFSAVVVMMREGQGKNAEHQGAHVQRHEMRAAAQSMSNAPQHTKHHGIITAIDKIKKTVSIRAQNGIQQAKNTLQLLPATFSYQPLSSADLDYFGKELEKRSNFSDDPAVIVTVDEESARFTMELQA